MSSFSDSINKKVFSKKVPSGREVFEDYSFIISKELGISPSDLLDYPIPLVLSLYDNIFKYYEEQKKASKKKR